MEIPSQFTRVALDYIGELSALNFYGEERTEVTIGSGVERVIVCILGKIYIIYI